MKKSKRYQFCQYSMMLLLILFSHSLYAQEPNFAQFISSPLTINPALIGTSDADWRVSTVSRRQWIGNVSPYSTQTISIDGRIRNLDDQRYFGLGGMLLSERAMDGLYKNTHLNLSLSYHQTLDEDGNGLSASLGFLTNNTRVDLGGLSFDQQLSSSGFDRALPTGENSIGRSSSNISAVAGLLYTYDTENSFINAGISGYRFVKTTRSVMDDPSQRITPRYTAHADFGTSFSDQINITGSMVYLRQNGISHVSFGAIFGYMLREDDYGSDKYRMFNIGGFYRLNDAISPYLGYTFNNLQFGLSYDVNASPAKGAASTFKSVELSIIYKKYLPAYRKHVGRFHSPY